MKKITALLLLTLTSISYAQKKKIDHTTYDEWNNVAEIQQTPSGRLISYTINPHKGDGALYIHNLDGNQTIVPRGEGAKLDANDEFAVFRITPYADTIRKLKLDKVKEDKLPKDSLGIYWPKKDSIYKVGHVTSFQIAENGGSWIAYLSSKDERPSCPDKKCRLFKKKNKCERPQTSGKTLHLLNLKDGATESIHAVVDFQLDPSGNTLVYTTSLQGKSDTLSMHMLSFQSFRTKNIMSGQLAFKHITFDDKGERLVFLHSADTNERKNFRFSYWDMANGNTHIIGDTLSPKMPAGMNVSAFYRPSFSRDGSRVFFGIAPIVEKEAKDTLLDSEKATLDVWSGRDLRIQPQQLKEKRMDERATFLTLYTFSDSNYIVLENEKVEQIRIPKMGEGQFTLGYDSKPYQRKMTWAFPWKRDIYLINLFTGNQELLSEGKAYEHSLSPSSSYFIWYEGSDSSWYSKSTGTSEAITNLTANFKALFATDVNGGPHIPYPEGSAGWFKKEGLEYFMVYSRNDIYALCPSNPNNSYCLTSNQDATEKVTYRYVRFDNDSLYTDLTDGLFSTLNEDSRAEGYVQLEWNGSKPKFEKVLESDHHYLYLSKAEKSDLLLYRRMNFTTYPDLIATNRYFEKSTPLTKANPQQEEYNWGSVEMVNWKSFEGRDLRGLLYKPEDFDSTKSYPMIVYYYEKYMDRFHYYYSPKPTASIVYPTEYVSNGYIIFIPDVEYTPGHPAASAYDCIVSGTDYLTGKHNWIDTNRMGLQGQSWGGYQTAQLITMTDKYAAAMAGAPVSNMFSAYGGVRWGSGLSRMFQYERTQSRIGYTIWEKPELYIENSPLFGLPNVKTPLLIMHNDGDGAVPWYQGIELYMGLRRLSQPVWMLNYNGDEHNLMQDANRRDLSIRMRQFFDHYLLGAPIPIWMDEGVPAIDKGKDYGLELKNSGGN